MRSGLIGVTSLHAYKSAILSGYKTTSFFKRAALMCDHIFIDTQGFPSEMPGMPAESKRLSRFQDAYIRMLLGGEEASSISQPDLRKLIVRPEDLGDDEAIIRSIYPYEEPDEGERGLYKAAHDVINDLTDEQLEAIGIQRSNDYKEQGTLILELVTDLQRANRLRRWLDEPVGLLTPLHQRVLGTQVNGTTRPPTSPFLVSAELEQSGVIDFAALSWSEILRLRRSSFLDDFRDQLEAVSRTDDISISQALWRDLWRFARDAQPSVMRTTVGGILGAIPLPLTAPLGIVASVAETQRAHEQAHEFGWLFFILEATRACPNASPN
jgi:hypothetical protein